MRKISCHEYSDQNREHCLQRFNTENAGKLGLSEDDIISIDGKFHPNCPIQVGTTTHPHSYTLTIYYFCD